MAESDPAPEQNAEAEAALTLTPYDAFFKSVFGEVDIMVRLMQSRLPEKLARPIHWDQVTLRSSSFVKQNLAQMHADLLFSTRAGEREVLLYVMLEHQSKVDKLM